MSDASLLSSAKNMLKEKRFQEAISIFEKIAEENLEESPEAEYCLGIINQTGSGTPKNVDEAAKHYLIAHQFGHPMATYRLGGIYHGFGQLQNAYNLYRSIAQNNPSAAYWAFRLLMINSKLDSDPIASEKYLNSAAEQGHIRAQRIIAMRYILGKKGLLNIPHGLGLFAKLVRNTFRATNRHEKMKYE